MSLREKNCGGKGQLCERCPHSLEKEVKEGFPENLGGNLKSWNGSFVQRIDSRLNKVPTLNQVWQR